jgi:hypothetical protein
MARLMRASYNSSADCDDWHELEVTRVEPHVDYTDSVFLLVNSFSELMDDDRRGMELELSVDQARQLVEELQVEIAKGQRLFGASFGISRPSGL